MQFTQETLRKLAAGLSIAVISFALAGCSDSESEDSASPSLDASASASPSAVESSASPTSTIEASSDLSVIEVTDTDIPEVTIPAPWAVDETRTRVLREGGDQKLEDTSTTTINYVGLNARTGEVFDSSYENAPATFSLQQVIAGFQKGLTGQTVGSRVLIAMPSEDGYATGNEAAGIEVGDTLVFVVDIISANYQSATGEPVTPESGLPTIEMTDEGPELSIPDGASKPSELVVQPLIEGQGTKVTAESTIQVKYRVWNWDTGEVVQDAWEPQQGALAELIEGWKQGLLDQPAGSRVMLVVPPDLAYPDGSNDPSVKPGQTLVYVIDLLYVQ